MRNLFEQLAEQHLTEILKDMELLQEEGRTQGG